MTYANLSPLANHLWQSTLFTAAAWLLTLALRKNRADVRYRIWLAASVKFLVPFSLLVSAGSQFGWRTSPAIAPSLLPRAVEQISQPFVMAADPILNMAAAPSYPVPALLFSVWLCGFAISGIVWLLCWQRFRAALRAATPLVLDLPIPVVTSPDRLEPGVFGIRKPILLLPEGIANLLTPAQLQSVLSHELCHVRRRDNLTAAIHMMVESIFWFHPLVWWIGARLVEERERACDEEVVLLGNEPDVYAEGILNVCKFYLRSPLTCASGVTGADLKRRIEAIVNYRISHRLTIARKLLLAAAGMAAVAGPVLVGILNVPQIRAQSKAEPLSFEVASVKPGDTNSRTRGGGPTAGGGMRIVNMPLKWIVMMAYDIQAFQISGGPAWSESQGFDIVAKATTETTGDTRLPTAEERRQARLRLQALLADRFRLVVRRETKELPVYALVVTKNGLRLKESTSVGGIGQGLGEMVGTGVTVEMLATVLARVTGRPVLDKTNLTARYDFTLKFAPERTAILLAEQGAAVQGAKTEGAGAADDSGPSVFAALQEQLGLKLESQKGPVEFIVIERAEKPTPN